MLAGAKKAMHRWERPIEMPTRLRLRLAGMSVQRVTDWVERLGQTGAAHARALGLRRTGSERYLGLAVVALVHLLAIWILVIGLKPAIVRPSSKEGELSVVVLGAVVAPHPTQQPELIDPTLPILPPPDVAIDSDPGPTAIAGASASVLLAPRPDPAHRNVPPRMPVTDSGNLGSLKVVLRVLVTADGTVTDAQISQSCGLRALDAIAISYVKDNWRFIPAMLGDRPVEDWTTIFVPFASD